MTLRFLLPFFFCTLASALPSQVHHNGTYLAARDGMGAIPVNRDVSKCPGYDFGDVSNSKNGLTAKLTLAGDECTAFGLDIKDLTVEVTYDTKTRLHVKIYDTVKNQFQIPESLIERSAPDPDSTADTSDLVFNYNAKPFEFWITRKGASDDEKPLFDTRKSSLPSTPVPPVHADDPSTALPAFNLIFEDQYIEITSALPKDTNLYGLGEYYSSSGFRRDTGASGGAGSVQALVANGWSVELDRNSYSVMPFYTEHRLDSAGKGKSHGVLALNSNQGDVLLLTPQDADQSIIQYRFLGGVLDFYVFSGPSPMDVVEQYGQLLGFPLWTPTWAFGFHLCRWGYKNVDDWRSRVDKMREANIPLEVQWVDIDFYDGHRVFTSDPQNFPMDSVKQFISDLASNNQRMIPIVDPGIAIMPGYAPHDSGLDRNVFIHMNNGSVTRGRVWPGDTYFPDWFAENTQDWWTQNLKDWHDSGVSFSGIWLDMNEASNFCDGICDVAYDPSTTKREIQSGAGSLVAKRAVDGDMTGRTKSGSVNFPPYQIHQNGGSLVKGNIDAFSMHGNGALEYDVHNMYGLGEEKATFNALVEINNGERPFLISRSAFPSSGRWTGHWLGDNHGDWWAMWASIQGMLQFTMNQIPMVGADTCGHMGVTTEDLCSRWMMMSAFTPFYRNHHTDDGNMQEPYLWESVADASRIALTARYSLLPYWATLFADVSLKGTPPMRALYWEFPDDASLFGVDQQFMVGPSILVTPVLEPDVQSVNGVLPGNEETEVWYDFWTHDVVTGKGNITMEAKMNQINVHVRGGSALLLHSKPAYTTVETRASPYTLLVALGAGSNATATGSVYLDDGLAYPPGPSTRLSISSLSSGVEITPDGEFTIEQKLAQIEVLGVAAASFVTVNGEKLPEDKWTFDQEKHKLIINHDGIDLNQRVQVAWATPTATPANCTSTRRSRRARR